MTNTVNILKKEAILEETHAETLKLVTKRHADSSIIAFSSMKYIDRFEISFEETVRAADFINLCEDLFWGHDFLVENVRWKRLDRHLAVAQATFVRFKPVEG